MSITYTWEVTGMKAKDQGPHTGVIFQTYWAKTGTDADGNKGVFSGATPFSAENVPVDQFVPMEQLTEEIVLGWIKSVVVNDYERHVNEQIQKQIDQKKANEADVKLPWKPQEDTPTPQAAQQPGV